MCARGVKFPLAFHACVFLNPQNSLLGWSVAAVSYVEVNSVLGTGKAIDKHEWP